MTGSFDPFAAQKAIREADASDDGAATLGTAKLLAYTLVTYADADGVCYPSMATLARDCGVARSTVYTALRDLRQHGLGRLRVDVARAGGGARHQTGGRATVHRLTVRPPIHRTSDGPVTDTSRVRSPICDSPETGHKQTNNNLPEQTTLSERVATESATPPPPRPKPPKPKTTELDATIDRLWSVYLDGWSRHVGRGPEPRLTAERRRMLRQLLAPKKRKGESTSGEPYRENHLADAARGLWASDWHREKRLTMPEHCWGAAHKAENLASQWRQREAAEPAARESSSEVPPRLSPDERARRADLARQMEALAHASVRVMPPDAAPPRPEPDASSAAAQPARRTDQRLGQPPATTPNVATSHAEPRRFGVDAQPNPRSAT